jgi:hypothetical protein
MTSCTRLRVSVLPLCLLAPFLGSCGKKSSTTKEIAPQAAVVPAPPKPAELLDRAFSLADISAHREAASILEDLLTKTPTDPRVWGAFEQEALASGKASFFLDSLSSTEPIGGDAARHYALRASLALAAGRNADAMEAATALVSIDPGAAAAFRARAAEAGAPVDLAALDPKSPTDALVLARMAENPKQRAALLAVASALSGWRPALLRAECALAAGETEKAALEARKVADEEDPWARMAGLEILAQLQSPKVGAAIAMEAAGVASEVHDVNRMASSYAQAVSQDLRAGAPESALDDGKTLLGAHPELGGEARMRIAVPLADAALAAGEVELALDLLVGDQSYLVKDQPALRRSVATSAVEAAYTLCDEDAFKAVIGDLHDAEATAAKGLLAACRGEISSAREKLDPTGLPPHLAVTVATAAATAHLGTKEATAWAQKAVDLADASDDLGARIRSRLELERQVRLAGDARAAEAALANLANLIPTPAVAMEAFVRRSLWGQSVEPPDASSALSPDAPAWRSIVSGTEAPRSGGGMAAWARARQALRAQDAITAATAFSEAVSSLPARRQDRWAPLLAITGGDGPNIDEDLRLATGIGADGAADSILALQEWARFIGMNRLAARTGDDVTRGAPDVPARAFRAAWARESARSVLWLEGTAPWPAEAIDATAKAWTELACVHDLPRAPGLEALRQRFPETAIFSIRLGPTSGEVLLVTPTAVLLTPVSDARSLRAAATAYRTELMRQAASPKGRTSPTAGDRLRSIVIDPGRNEVAGLAKYLIVADSDLLELPWAALPEQSEGRRYLADIRAVGVSPLLSLLLHDHPAPAEGYKPDFLGLGIPDPVEEVQADVVEGRTDAGVPMDVASIRTPGELTSASKLFGGGSSIVKQGGEATLEQYRSASSKARYLDFAGLGPSSDGGLALPDGNLTLGEIRCSGLCAHMAVVGSVADPQVQVARAYAFLESGAETVLVAMWTPPLQTQARYVTRLFDALNRDRSPARALSEARDALGTETSQDVASPDPSIWGGMVLFGPP